VLNGLLKIGIFWKKIAPDKFVGVLLGFNAPGAKIILLHQISLLSLSQSLDENRIPNLSDN